MPLICVCSGRPQAGPRLQAVLLWLLGGGPVPLCTGPKTTAPVQDLIGCQVFCDGFDRIPGILRSVILKLGGGGPVPEEPRYHKVSGRAGKTTICDP